MAVNQEESRSCFTIDTKDGIKHEMNFICTGYNPKCGNDKIKEIRKLYNEYNNVHETYLLENTIFIRINGEQIKFGCRCENNVKEYVYLTNLEIDNLRKEFKIRDDGWRHLCYIEAFKIEGNKVNHPISQSYLDNLVYMGYDISKLEYELAEE